MGIYEGCKKEVKAAFEGWTMGNSPMRFALNADDD